MRDEIQRLRVTLARRESGRGKRFSPELTYTVKNLVADIYLDDLRDKTLRGLEGRHHANLSTGNPPYGYRSVSVGDSRDEHAGRRVEIDEEKANIVRRVFAMYLDGRSLNAMARALHEDGVPPPRANTRHRRKGWVDVTIRCFLHNEKYAGIWRYKERQWSFSRSSARRSG